MTDIRSLVAAELDQPVDDRVKQFAAVIAARHPAGATAVLYYGSCLRTGVIDGEMLDFYLIVDRYRSAYNGRLLAAANRLIPPNVFYIEEGGLRAKYAVLSIADFHRLNAPGAPDVSVWARFAQPSALVWVNGEGARTTIAAAVAQAAPTLFRTAGALLPRSGTARDYWTVAFALTYGAELRAESGARPGVIFDLQPVRYAMFLMPALAAAGMAAGIEGDTIVLHDAPTAAERRRSERLWTRLARRGKRTSLARLAKATFTFNGGIDYIAWKITRHSGQPVHLKPWHRRHPILAGLLLLPRLRRSGAIR